MNTILSVIVMLLLSHNAMAFVVKRSTFDSYPTIVLQDSSPFILKNIFSLNADATDATLYNIKVPTILAASDSTGIVVTQIGCASTDCPDFNMGSVNSEFDHSKSTSKSPWSRGWFTAPDPASEFTLVRLDTGNNVQDFAVAVEIEQSGVSKVLIIDGTFDNADTLSSINILENTGMYEALQLAAVNNAYDDSLSPYASAPAPAPAPAHEEESSSTVGESPSAGPAPPSAPAPAPAHEEESSSIVGESPSAAPATCSGFTGCDTATEYVLTGATCQAFPCTTADCCDAKAQCNVNDIICGNNEYVDTNLYCAGDQCTAADQSTCCADKAQCNVNDIICGNNQHVDTSLFCAGASCSQQTDQSTCCADSPTCTSAQLNCGTEGTTTGTYNPITDDTTSCACNCGEGYGVDGTGVCEQCSDGDQPQWNALTDASPCGNHTACLVNQKFAYDSTTDTGRCTPCGLDQFSAGGFVTECTAYGRCEVSNICDATTQRVKAGNCAGETCDNDDVATCCEERALCNTFTCPSTHVDKNGGLSRCVGASCNTNDDLDTCCAVITCTGVTPDNSLTTLPSQAENYEQDVLCETGYRGGGSWTCVGGEYTGPSCEQEMFMTGEYYNVTAAPVPILENKKECLWSGASGAASMPLTIDYDGTPCTIGGPVYWANNVGEGARLYVNPDCTDIIADNAAATATVLDFMLNYVVPKLYELDLFGGDVPEFTSIKEYGSGGYGLDFWTIDNDGDPQCSGDFQERDTTSTYKTYTFTATRTSKAFTAPAATPATCDTFTCGAGYTPRSGAASLTCDGDPCTDDDRNTCCIAHCTTRGYDNYNRVGPCACRDGRSFNTNVNRCMRSALETDTATTTCTQTSINSASLSTFSLNDHKTRFTATTEIQRRAERKARRQERRDLFAAVKQLRDTDASGTCNEDTFIDIDVWLPRKKEKLARWRAVQTVKLLSPATNDACAVEITNFDELNAFDCVHEDDGDECVVCNNGAKLAKVTLTSGENDAYTCECYDSNTWTETTIVEETENGELVDYCVCDGHKIGVDSASGTVDFCGVTGGDNSTCTGCMDSTADNYDATATLPGACTYTNPICVEVGQKVHMGDGSMRAVEHLRPGDVLRTPEGTTTVRSTRRGGRHLSDVHDVTCGAQKGTITGNHAYHCEGEWRLPTNTHEPRALEGVTEVVAVETDNYCEDRMILEHGLEVETWDGRGINEWRPHAFENGRRLRCTLKGTWRDQVLKRMDSRT